MLMESHTVDLILIAWDLRKNLLSTGKKIVSGNKTGVHHVCNTKIKSRQASHIIFTSSLETKQGKANKPGGQRVAIQPASLDCLKSVTVPEPWFPLTENNHEKRGREKKGTCLGCVDLADLSQGSSEMVVFHMKRLYPMSPADKTLSLSKKI